MLLPNHEELVALRSQTNRRGLDTKTKVTATAFGGHASLFKGRGLDFSEFREYVHGDDIRSIDWRVTARTGRAHTKIFTEERERSVYVILDINSYMDFGTRKTFKSVQAARAASLIAWSANRLDDKFGAILFGRHRDGFKLLAARRSRKSIWEMLRILCAERPSHPVVKIEDALDQARRQIPWGSAVFIISDFYLVSEQLEKSLGLLSRGRDLTLIKVTDPADRNMPHADRVQLSNDEGARTEINTSDVSGNRRYLQQWAQSDRHLTAAARKFRNRLIRITTNGNFVDDMFANRTSIAEEVES